MSAAGWVVGVTGRRAGLLDSLATELSNRCHTSSFDVTKTNEAVTAFETLIEQMGGVDVVVINSGFGQADPSFALDLEMQTVAVNVTGFTVIANAAYRYFQGKGTGHIVGISSVAAVRGGPLAVYNASKAYVSSYLEGMACRKESRNGAITITDIRPGFVDTPMTQGGAGMFWVATPERAGQQIYTAIEGKKRVAYITKRWRLVAMLMACVPFFLYRKLIGSGADV